MFQGICFSLSHVIWLHNFSSTCSKNNYKVSCLLISLQSFSFSNNALASLFFGSLLFLSLFSFFNFLISDLLILKSSYQAAADWRAHFIIRVRFARARLFFHTDALLFQLLMIVAKVFILTIFLDSTKLKIAWTKIRTFFKRRV